MLPRPRPARRQCPERDNGTPGSDFMVDVIKTLDIKISAGQSGSSYRGLHESLINYGNNTIRNSSPARTKNPASRCATATSRRPANRS